MWTEKKGVGRKSNIHSISTKFPSKRVGMVWSFKELWKVNVRPGCGPMSLPPAVDFLSGMHITFSASRMASAQHSHSFSVLNYTMLPFLISHLQSEKCHCQGSMKTKSVATTVPENLQKGRSGLIRVKNKWKRNSIHMHSY